MTSRSVGIVALAVAGLALAGCSATDSGGSSGGDIKLEFQTGLGAADPVLKQLQDITATCAVDGVTVELVPMTNTYEADMKTRLASNDVPDIWSTHGWSLLRYSDFLEPLNDRPWAGNFNEALAPAMQSADGQFFALPMTTDVAGILYNAGTLKAAGVDPTSIKTWADFEKALAKLKAAGVTPVSSSSKDSWMSGNIADLMAGGAYSEADLKKFTDGEFVEGGYTELLGEVKKWADAGYFNADFTSITMDEIGRGLGAGDVGFVFVQNSLAITARDQNPDAEIGFIPIPAFVGDQFFVGGEGTAFGVAKEGKNKEAALTYLDCLAKPDNQATMAKSLGAAPGLTDAKVDLGALQGSYDEYVAGGEYPLVPYFDRVSLPNGMWDTMTTTTSAVITGQSSVADSVSQMKQQFGSLYGQN